MHTDTHSRASERPHVNQLCVKLAAENKQMINSINTKKKAFSAHTLKHTQARPLPLHLQLKGHCSSCPPHPHTHTHSLPLLQLCLCVSLLFCGHSFLSTRGLGPDRATTPPHPLHPSSFLRARRVASLSFGGVGRPSPFLTANTADRGAAHVPLYRPQKTPPVFFFKSVWTRASAEEGVRGWRGSSFSS